MFASTQARKLFAVTGALVLLSACGDEVCIQWGESEGACPTPNDVDQFLPQDCTEPIESIDSEGELVDGACCYDATTGDEDSCFL